MTELEDRLKRQLRDCLAACRTETQKLRAAKLAADAEAARLRRELEAPMRERYRRFATKRLKQERAHLRQQIAISQRTMTAFTDMAWKELMLCVHPDSTPTPQVKARTFLEIKRREPRLKANYGRA